MHSQHTCRSNMKNWEQCTNVIMSCILIFAFQASRYKFNLTKKYWKQIIFNWRILKNVENVDSFAKNCWQISLQKFCY